VNISYFFSHNPVIYVWAQVHRLLEATDVTLFFFLKIKRKDATQLSVSVFDNTQTFEPVDHFSRTLVWTLLILAFCLTAILFLLVMNLYHITPILHNHSSLHLTSSSVSW